MNYEDFLPIVQRLPKEFTSHVFIKEYIRAHEPEYISELQPIWGGFRNLNSNIARELERHQEYLHISKGEEKDADENIKGYISKNAKWTRTDL